MAEELKADAAQPGIHTGVPEIVSVLPLRDAVLFPHAVMPLGAGRESSIRLIEDATSGGRAIGTFGQLVASMDTPQEGDRHRIGTFATIHKVFKQPDGSVRLVVQGMTRIRLIEVIQTRPFLRARVEEVPDIMPAPGDLETEALTRNAKTLFQKIVELSPILPDEVADAVNGLDHPGRVADAIAASLPSLTS